LEVEITRGNALAFEIGELEDEVPQVAQIWLEPLPSTSSTEAMHMWALWTAIFTCGQAMRTNDFANAELDNEDGLAKVPLDQCIKSQCYHQWAESGMHRSCFVSKKPSLTAGGSFKEVHILCAHVKDMKIVKGDADCHHNSDHFHLEDQKKGPWMTFKCGKKSYCRKSLAQDVTGVWTMKKTVGEMSDQGCCDKSEFKVQEKMAEHLLSLCPKKPV
jgi:hypothetical protein